MTLSFEYIPNIDISALAKLIKGNTLYESSYSSSRFKYFTEIESYIEEVIPYGWHNDSVKISGFSVVLAYNGKTAIGILIFEHYNYLKGNTIKFTHNKIKKSFSMLGFVGIYVKPEFRGIGIAREMASVLNDSFKNIKKNNSFDHLNLISAVGNAAHIVEKYVENISFTRSPYNNHCWKDDSKQIFSSISHLEKHYYLNSMAGNMIEFA